MSRTLLLSTILAFQAGFASASEPNPAIQQMLDDVIMPWAGDAVLSESIAAQNTVTTGYDSARIDELDQKWRAEVGTDSSDLVNSVLQNDAADFLRSQIEASGGAITEIFIMDQHGLNVAASGATSDYWQGDEAKFQQTYPVGAQAIHVSEIEFDESSQTYQAQVSMTITGDDGAPIGAMTVGIDAELIM